MENLKSRKGKKPYVLFNNLKHEFIPVNVWDMLGCRHCNKSCPWKSSCWEIFKKNNYIGPLGYKSGGFASIKYVACKGNLVQLGL